jgi:hypothetical protein
MTPLGSLIMTHIRFLENYRVEITAGVVGMILHISTTILFESAENHKFNLGKLTVILAAIILSFII